MTKNINTKIVAGLTATAIAMLIALYPVEPAPLTVNEWQLLAKIYDLEIKKAGGMSFQNFTTEDFFKKINKKIKTESLQKGMVTIDEVELTEMDYKKLRDNLFEKTEKQALLTKFFEGVK